MVPKAVLMKSGLVSVNAARQVNTAYSKTTMNAAKPMSNLSKIAHSTVKRPIHKKTAFENININQRVNTIKGKKFNTDQAVNTARPKATVNTVRPKAVVNIVKGNSFNVVKALACWAWKPKTKVLDHASKHNNASMTLNKHMTGNMSYLTNYEEIDGGYVAFGGNLKGGKITGKCTHYPHKTTTTHNTLIPQSGRCSRESTESVKGWMREVYRVRTPQQNGVAERKNRTLIEAAKTMLADSKLPTTFWPEAVSTACYVQNRVLVVKPHNKTPYELFHGKFDGKADEGFFVGYTLNSSGPDWLFDIDALTRIMNYELIYA
ncbi:putative ribonuclease H-like domain-containing protein [Tanacetum coccineum]